MHDEVGGVGEFVGGETSPLPVGEVQRLTVGQAARVCRRKQNTMEEERGALWMNMGITGTLAFSASHATPVSPGSS